ncbi:MAG: hemerythrin domain-containing protein [bacterium]|nr:hemerythrin domain-containing protein [bacterium]
METSLYRRQHEQILRQLNLIDGIGPQGSPWQFRHELKLLASLVKLHCSMLQGSLYPRLALDEREEVRALARRGAEHAASCGADLERFIERWDDEAIHRARASFLEGYYALRDDMREQIARERTQLFDRIDPRRLPVLLG